MSKRLDSRTGCQVWTRACDSHIARDSKKVKRRCKWSPKIRRCIFDESLKKQERQRRAGLRKLSSHIGRKGLKIKQRERRRRQQLQRMNEERQRETDLGVQLSQRKRKEKEERRELLEQHFRKEGLKWKSAERRRKELEQLNRRNEEQSIRFGKIREIKEEWAHLFSLSPEEFQKEIAKIYKKYAYPLRSPNDLKNECTSKRYRAFMRHQKFLKKYFTPLNPSKGLLIWHSVGVGKTCLAISTLSYQFEPDHWNILWVTRRALDKGPLGSMFKDLCHERVRESAKKILAQGGRSSEKHSEDEQDELERLRDPANWDQNFNHYVRKRWSGATLASPQAKTRKRKSLGAARSDRILTFLEFENIVKRQGATRSRLDRLGLPASWNQDRLHRTVIVFDEAHNLYNTTDLPQRERPHNVSNIEQAIWHSYATSGQNSCRVILLTATPILEGKSMTSLNRLLNLTLRPKKELDAHNKYVGKMPITLQDIEHKYFSSSSPETGLHRFMEDTKGVISYFEGTKQPNLFPTKMSGHLIPTQVTPLQLEKIRSSLGVAKLSVPKPAGAGASKKKSTKPPGCSKYKRVACGDPGISPHCLWTKGKGCKNNPDFQLLPSPSPVSVKSRVLSPPTGPQIYSPFPVASSIKEMKNVRKYANWANLPNKMILDSPSFDKKYFKDHWREYSSKYEGLLSAIYQTDQFDLKKHGTLFKHAIYTDLGRDYRGYGVKLISAILLAENFEIAKFSSNAGRGSRKSYKVHIPAGKGGPNRLTFIPLSSTSFKGSHFFTNPHESFPDTADKRAALGTAAKNEFNKRSNNIHGENIRFMLLDSGFKEGIDLFDVRHIWITEPPMSRESLAQAIGRVTRLCGASGLPFQKNVGWIVYIHVLYSVMDVKEEDGLAHTQMIYKLEMNKTEAKLIEMKTGLIKMSIASSLDKLLFINVHEGISQKQDPELFLSRRLGIH